MKKTFLITIAFILLAIGSVQANSEFSDSQNHWAKDHIKSMSAKGFIKGYEDGKFRPNADITRAEFLTILARIVELPGASNSFSDSSTAIWANENIGGAAQVGIIIPGEYPNNRFEPNKPITRLEMSKMIARAFALDSEYKSLLNTYQKLYNGDMVFTDWKQMQQKDIPYIALTFGTGISAGYPDGSFGINKLTNRAEATVMLERFMNAKNKQPYSFQYLNEMKEIAETGTNATAVSSLQPNQEHYAGLELDHFAFNFKTKRVYVIPFYDVTGKTSMYERKFIVDRETVMELNSYYKDENNITGVIATVGDMTFKNDETYFNNFGSRLFVAGGTSFFYEGPRYKYGLEYMLMTRGTFKEIQRGKTGETREMVMYGGWNPDRIGIDMTTIEDKRVELFFNPNNVYRNR